MKAIKPYNESSYLSQVRRLRDLARLAISCYPVAVKSIHFIHHGENTTFRVIARTGQSFLLRIHRNDYHTKEAIEEEMEWLSHLTKFGLTVPNPIRSKTGQLVVTVESIYVGARNCSVFKWIPGRIARNSVRPKDMFQVGKIIADFQNHSPSTPPKNRNYWTAHGLVGPKPKFGQLDRLARVTRKQQNVITETRKIVFEKLKRYEKKFPNRLGLIHADLHFGNLVRQGPKFGAIDFDDCGHGFFVYDLVIPYVSVQSFLKPHERKLLPQYKEALIEGYKQKRAWDKNDEVIFPYLVMARRLLMLGWLNSRSDNPRLKKYFKTAVQKVLRHIKESNL